MPRYPSTLSITRARTLPTPMARPAIAKARRRSKVNSVSCLLRLPGTAGQLRAPVDPQTPDARGLWIAQTEGAKFWLQVLTELKRNIPIRERKAALNRFRIEFKDRSPQQ